MEQRKEEEEDGERSRERGEEGGGKREEGWGKECEREREREIILSQSASRLGWDPTHLALLSLCCISPSLAVSAAACNTLHGADVSCGVYTLVC